MAWRGVAWRGVRACFAYLLAVLIILSQIHITAFAAGDIEYIGSDGNTATISEDQATSIASGTTTWGASGVTKWYVADGTVNIGSRVEIKGDVHLILKDGSNLTVEDGIRLTGANSLTIYGQSGGTGHLTALNVERAKAGIGGNALESNSSLTINGGNITVTGGNGASGIGGGNQGHGGSITINRGNVTATGGNYGAGIGGGDWGSGGTVTVSGGIVTATGGYNAAGIGGGDGGSGGTVTVSGGIVTATGGQNAAGIGGGADGAGGTFSTGTNGSAIIYTNRIADQSQSSNWKGIIFKGDNGKVHGTVTLNDDLTIPSGKTLEIDSGNELVIPSGKTLTNDGTINNNGTITNNGTIINNGRIVNNGTIQNNGTITNSGQIEGMGSISGNPVQTPPSIRVQPQNQTVNAGESFSFTVTATGTLPLTYQWQVKTADDWENINDETSDTYEIVSVSFAMNGNQYRCKVTNDVGTATSSEVTLTVNKIQLPTPAATIDYGDEKLTGLTVNVGYKIKVDNGNEQEITAGEYGKISIEAGWFGKELSIKEKATDDNHMDSEEQKINISARPVEPNGLQGVNETFDGQNDGKITGTTAQMEYKLANGDSWTPCLDSNTTSLAPGTYQVRIAATDSSFASLPVQIGIATGEARTYTLNVTAPTFDAAEYGYMQPTAKSITIQNTGNTTSTITRVELNNTGSFEIAGSGNSVDAGGSITTYTIQPKEGLAVGTHTETITVEYTNSGIATAQVLFTVEKATQTPPVKPELDTKTHNSVTLKVISANSNAAVVEYSKDNGITYQDSNVFTGLSPNTTYSFVARYKATNDGNYKESNPSTAVQITTDNSTSGSSSGSDSGSSGTGYYTDSSSSSNTENQSTLSELKPIKVDANGKAVITKDIIKTAIAFAKAQAKAGQEISVNIKLETGTTLNKIQIVLNADALSELVSSKVHRFTMDTDTSVDWSLNTETLSELKKMTGDSIFSMSKVNPTSKEAKAAIGKRPVYDISIAYSKNGQETKIETLNGKTVSLSIPYTATKKEKAGKLYAVYVDKQGKVEWLTKSSYDKDNKAVLFETDHFSIYGVGYKKTLPNFNDITNHWAKEDILFVVSREMFSGTGKTTFSPDVKLTRGMFVTALGRLSEIDTENYKQGRFIDVKENAYYTAYVNWAAEQGIVNGTSKDTFEPDKSITREEMAVILKNYAEKLGYTLPKTLEEIKFTDDGQISDWAKEAVKEMQKAGILQGKINNGFDPKGEATRAEAAAILHRFVEVAIDPQSANGWTKNDSGQISYYKDGQAVKGWFKENGKTYWFNQKTAKMFRNGFKKIDGKTYYFYKDGTMAVNKVIKKKKIGPDGVVS